MPELRYDATGVSEREARSGSSRDFFFVRKDRCGWWGLGDGEWDGGGGRADESIRLPGTGERELWLVLEAVFPITISVAVSRTTFFGKPGGLVRQ